MAIQLSDTKRKLIEELGVVYEQSGIQPAAARILSLLTVSDRVELSFEEIYETLNISKSAASNAISTLVSIDRLEYITKSGERKRYFRCKINGLKQGIQRSLTGIGAMNDLLKQVLAERTKETVEFNATLTQLTRFLDFIEKELPLLIGKWEKQNP